MHRPLAGGLLDHPHDLLALFLGAPGGREGHHVAHDLGGVRRVVYQNVVDLFSKELLNRYDTSFG